MRVGFTRETTGLTEDEEFCRHIYERENDEMSNDAMSEDCDRFCEGGVALRLGSLTYGFNLAQVQSLCLPDAGVLKFDSDLLSRCSRWSRSFRTVEYRTADFLAQLLVFEATRWAYAAAARVAVRHTQDFVASQQFKDGVARAEDKVDAFIHAFEDVDDYDLNAARVSLVEAIEILKVRADELASAMRSSMGDIDNFFDQCSEMHTGVGPNVEYLLDLCARSGRSCIEEDNADHVSCCCAHHPFMTFSEIFSPSTISGLESFDGSHIGRGRRMQAEEEEEENVPWTSAGWRGRSPPAK